MEIGYAQAGRPCAGASQTPTQAPEKVRLAHGNLYVDKAFMSLEDVALFDGARTVRFKDGSERELPEALAVSSAASPSPNGRSSPTAPAAPCAWPSTSTPATS